MVLSASRKSDPAFARELEAAKRSYRVTHWGNKGDFDFREAACADPRGVLTYLGEFVSLEYRATKSGDPPNSLYDHHFKNKLPSLAYNKEGKLVILDGSYRVTIRGIVG